MESKSEVYKILLYCTLHKQYIYIYTDTWYIFVICKCMLFRQYYIYIYMCVCVCPTPLLRIIWTLGFCIASLPTERWVQRALHWKPAGARVAGHPRHNWTSKFQSCTKHGQIDDWYTLASNKGLWTHLIADFVVFVSGQTR